MDPIAAITKYAEAKSRADVETALSACTPDVVIDTIPFQIASHGVDETRSQLEAFFEVFPDYHVEAEGIIRDGDTVVGWGEISATMKAAMLDLEATGRTFTVPFTCVWDTRDGLIARERFYFDLNAVAEQLGLSTDKLAATLKVVRSLYEQPAPTQA